MRPLSVWPLLLAAACSTAPPPTPAGPASVAGPAPSTAAGAASTRPPPPPPPTAPSDLGPPPAPPMAVRWTFHLPGVAGQPATTQRFALLETGDATWESAHGGGDGKVDEELSPEETAPPEVKRCSGHVGPLRHRRMIMAARQAMTSGCGQAAAVDRLGRPADPATTTIAVIWAGEIKSCDLRRSGGSYAAWEEVRAEAVAAICARP